MKLFAIQFTHYSQKDSKSGIKLYALADSDEQVLARLDGRISNSQAEFTYGAWSDRSEEMEDDDDRLNIYNDGDYKAIGRDASYLAKMLRLRGEMNDPDATVEDAYYGVTHWGWSEGKEITEAQAAVLLELGIAEDWREVAA